MTGVADAFSLVQSVGYLATVVSIGAYALRSDSSMKAGVGLSLLIWSVHYAMLGAWTASGTCLLIASRQVLALLAPNLSAASRRVAAGVYGLAFTVVLCATWTGMQSLLPWAAAVNATYAYFFLKGVRLRGQVMASTGLWFVNALLLGSLGGMATNVTTLCISTWTVARLRRTAGQPLPA
jgi:hypothetical protein